MIGGRHFPIREVPFFITINQFEKQGGTTLNTSLTGGIQCGAFCYGEAAK